MNGRSGGASVVEDRYCRVTVLGRHTQADVALASGQAIGTLLPEIARLLREPSGPRLMALVTSTGAELSPATTLGDNDIADGAILQLLSGERPPPAPVVNDLTEEVAEDLDHRRDRFGGKSRRLFAVTVAAIGPAMIGIEVARSPASLGAAPIALWVAAGLLLAVAALSARLDHRWPSTVAAVSAATLANTSAQLLADDHSWAVRDRLGLGLVIGWLGVLVVAGVWRAAGTGVGAVVGAVGSGAWWSLAHLGVTGSEADAVIAVAAVVAVGALPRWAVVVSGLSSLDDSRSAGNAVRRPVVHRTIGRAHETLTATTVALALLAGVSGGLLAANSLAWPVTLAAVAAAALVLRSRAFPLTPEVAPLAVAGTAIAASALIGWSARTGGLTGSTAITVGLTALSVAALLWRPSAHLQVRLRQLGDRLEAVAVIALIPSLLGVFGVYDRLLHTF
ncbi:MAG: type secretion integral rane protein EccD [Frankiales bacterium]|nr:type secretion integral rane protein EccD [Frankiales bacterium]